MFIFLKKLLTSKDVTATPRRDEADAVQNLMTQIEDKGLPVNDHQLQAMLRAIRKSPSVYLGGEWAMKGSVLVFRPGIC